MKFNGEVDLRQRARRKWFVLLACLLIAGGWWYRADQQKKRAAARLDVPEAIAKTPSSGTPSPQVIDESVASPFQVPAVAFGSAGRDGSNQHASIDYSRPVVMGLNPKVSSHTAEPWLGLRTTPAATAIPISQSDQRTVGGLQIEPNRGDFVPPVVPIPAAPGLKR
jgi:hypothetical protein